MFSDWLLKELNEKEWSQADLSRASGLTTAAISKYLSGRTPEETSIKKIAHALRLPPEVVFRAAGILPPVPEKDADTEQIIHLYNTLKERSSKKRAIKLLEVLTKEEENERRKKS